MRHTFSTCAIFWCARDFISILLSRCRVNVLVCLAISNIFLLLSNVTTSFFVAQPHFLALPCGACLICSLPTLSSSRRVSQLFPMTSLSIVGMFSLANGHREQISSSQTKSTTYIVYDSSISCPDDTGVDLQIRHFSPNVLPDNTVALIVGKVAFPCCTTASPPLASPHAVLVTMHFFVFPGDPSSEEYDGTLPDFLHPIVFGVGHVSNVGRSTESPRSFTISTSSYISGTSIPSSITYDFHFL